MLGLLIGAMIWCLPYLHNRKTGSGNMLQRTRTLINKKYLEFFVPTVLTAMANSVAMLLDATIVNLALGSKAFASVNLVSPIIQLYVAISILFGLSSATIIAKIKGQDGTDARSTSASFTTAMYALLVVSALLMVVQFAFVDSIVALLTPDPTLQILLKPYYLPFITGTPITLVMTSGVYIIRTEGRPKFASSIIIVSNLVNLVFDLFLILVFHLGMTGAAVATVIGNTVGLVMFLSHFRRPDNTLGFSHRYLRGSNVLASNLKSLLAYGTSGALGAALITVRLFFLNSLVQFYGGAQALVAFSVVSLCQILDSAFVAGACQTMVPISSMLYGERDREGIRSAFSQALKILLISSVTIMLLMEIFANSIVYAYGMTDAVSMVVGAQAVRICALMFPADALTFLGLYHFISLGRNGVATSISVMSGVAFVIPLGLVLPLFMGLPGVWAALSLAQYLALAYVLVVAAVLRRKQRNGLVSSATEPESETQEPGVPGPEASGPVVSGPEAREWRAQQLCSFSLNGAPWTNELEAELKAKVEAGFGVRPEADTGAGFDAALCKLSACLRVLDAAPLEKHVRSKNTDVRICTDQIVIKNNGACVRAEDFPDASFSKVLGFNQIIIA